MTIQEILKDCLEEKYDNPSTTSIKFKQDLYDFFNGPEFKSVAAIEFGTHKGQTTRVLSYLFDHVYTINLPNNFDTARVNNSDRNNITYIGLNLNSEPQPIPEINHPLTVVFIDAIHTTKNVLMDIDRCMIHPTTDVMYFIFDDFGATPEVNAAVATFLDKNGTSIVKYIGHPPMTKITKTIILNTWEGVIIKYDKTV